MGVNISGTVLIPAHINDRYLDRDMEQLKTEEHNIN